MTNHGGWRFHRALVTLAWLVVLAVNWKRSQNPPAIDSSQPSAPQVKRGAVEPHPLPATTPAPSVQSMSAASPREFPLSKPGTWTGADPDRERPFADFARWTVDYLATLPRNPAVELEGLRLASLRKHQMEDLIESDPKRALDLALPREIRSQLPESMRSLIEEPISATGSLMVRASLPLEGSAVSHPAVERFAEIGERTYTAHVYGRRLGEPSRRDIPLHGIAVANSMAVDENPARVLSVEEAKIVAASGTVEPICGIDPTSSGPGAWVDTGNEVKFVCGTAHAEVLNDRLIQAESRGFQQSSEGTLAASTYTEGLKTLILIRVDFPDLRGAPFSDAQAETLVNGLHAFYDESSYHKTGFKKIGQGSEVTPTFRMPQNASYYGTNDASKLRTDARAAARAGGYNLANYNFDVTWFGSVPGYNWSGLGYVGSPGAWIQNTASTGVVAHELGHNFGLNHANFWDTTGQSIIGAGTSVEYGDKYDTMGSANAGAKHFNARYKSLLNWIPASGVLSPALSGTYRIFAHDDVDSTGAVAIRLPRSSTTNYWVEYRQHYTGNKWMSEGVTLRWAGTGNQSTRLIDVTPGTTAGKDDAALLIGRTFSDPSAQLFITPIGKGGTTPESIDIVVNRGAFAGNRPPAVNLSASSNATALNSDLSFAATASDPDGDSLAYYWDFGDGSFAGNSSTAKHRWAAAGEYPVRCEVTDMKGGLAVAHLLIKVGTPSTFRLSGRVVTQEGIPVQGARIAASSTLMTWTDSGGNYDLPGLPAGTYSIKSILEGYLFSPSGFANPLNVAGTRNGIDFVAVPPSGIGTVPLVAAGSVWQYLDTGEDLGTTWSAPNFDSSRWKEGSTPMGYGDDNEKTRISFGPDANAKFVTTYFRKKFAVGDTRQISSLSLGLRRDDGGVVYLNGKEIFRSNMPTGTVKASTLASSTVGGTDETAFFTTDLDPKIILQGANVLAVEIHQGSRTSSDVVFDLELLASLPAATVPPVLAVEQAAASLRLSWPDSAKPWFLYVNSELEGESFWTPVTATPTIANGRRTLQIPASEGQRFFRLSDQVPNAAAAPPVDRAADVRLR